MAVSLLQAGNAILYNSVPWSKRLVSLKVRSFPKGSVPAHLMSFLFGNILTVPRTDVLITLLLVLVVTAVVVVFYKGFVAIALDEEYALTTFGSGKADRGIRW
jgi:hypothetical protein